MMFRAADKIPGQFIADKLCGTVANPIIRNAQEKRQLSVIRNWLEARGYKPLPSNDGAKFNMDMKPPKASIGCGNIESMIWRFLESDSCSAIPTQWNNAVALCKLS